MEKGGIVLDMVATILPKITANVPSSFIAPSEDWYHLKRIKLADMKFCVPAKIDLILGADISDKIMCQGRRTGKSESPTALKTIFGWVLLGPVSRRVLSNEASTCYVATAPNDEELRRFWEIEECNFKEPVLSVNERAVITHFNTTHAQDEFGRFVVMLPRKEDSIPFEESRSTAIRRQGRIQENTKGGANY